MRPKCSRFGFCSVRTHVGKEAAGVGVGMMRSPGRNRAAEAVAWEGEFERENSNWGEVENGTKTFYLKILSIYTKNLLARGSSAG